MSHKISFSTNITDQENVIAAKKLSVKWYSIHNGIMSFALFD